VGNVSRDAVLEDAVFNGENLLKLAESPAINDIAKIMTHIGGYYAAT
jgi:hypothetical protein